MARSTLAVRGCSNIEWIERGLREALHKDACGLLESLLNDPEVPIKNNEKRDGERRLNAQTKEIQTIFGKVKICRSYFYSSTTSQGRYPLDEALGLVKNYSPGLARVISRAGGRDSYEMASNDLSDYAGIDVDARQINRLVDFMAPQMRKELREEKLDPEVMAVPNFYVSADGTGIPMRKEELEGVKGKQDDGTAKTKEVKLGCVFTSHPQDGEDPFRDMDSTSYIATLMKSGDFGAALRREALRRGMGRAENVVYIGDGAAWVWENARVNFPGAVQILDYYHASEHLTDLVDHFYDKGTQEKTDILNQWKALLWEDGIEMMIHNAKAKAKNHNKEIEINKEIAYFEKNKDRMKYATFREQGYFIGSGVVEAGCKNVIGKRVKQSGMFWSKQGAENVLTLRSALYSNRFDVYWDRKNDAFSCSIVKSA